MLVKFLLLAPTVAAGALMGSATFAATPAPLTAKAMPTCKSSNPVVWVDPVSKTYYMKGSPLYGKAPHGLYLCQNAAVTAGNHASKTLPGSMNSTGSSMTNHGSPLASAMPSAPAGIETNQMPNSTSSSSPSP